MYEFRNGESNGNRKGPVWVYLDFFARVQITIANNANKFQVWVVMWQKMKDCLENSNCVFMCFLSENILSEKIDFYAHYQLPFIENEIIFQLWISRVWKCQVIV